jgi:hypothetical protein
METKYTQQLKDIVYDYYNRSLSLEDYRAERSKIIDEMEMEFNDADYVVEHNVTTHPSH